MKTFSFVKHELKESRTPVDLDMEWLSKLFGLNVINTLTD